MSAQTDDARDPVGWVLSLAALLRRLRELDDAIQAIAEEGRRTDESSTTSEQS